MSKPAPASIQIEITKRNPAYQALQILHWGFTAVPLLAGLDKFFMNMADWTLYLWAPLGHMFGAQNLLTLAGVIEIVIALVVGIKPKVGGVLLAIWLWLTIINLLLLQNHYDLALGNVGLSAGALGMSRLAAQFERLSRYVH